MRMVKNNVLKIYGYYFFRSFILAYVIERLFWESRGMSIADTVYTEFIYAFAIIILEIPSGLWADQYGRKKVILLGSFFNVATLLLMLFAHNFVMFAVAILLSAVNGALTSGSTNALLYDSLVVTKSTDRFGRILANIKMIRYSSGLIAALIGGWTASKSGFLFNYQISLISTIVALLFALSLKEVRLKNQVKEDQGERHSIKELVLLTTQTLKQNHRLTAMMVSAGVVGSAVIYFEEFWQNYFGNLSVPVVYFGLFSASMSISVIIASNFSPNIVQWMLKKPWLSHNRHKILLLIMASLYLSAGVFPSILALVLMCLAVATAAINENMIHCELHHHIASENRATMESVYDMIERLFVVVLGLVFGWVSDIYTVFTGFASIGIALITLNILISMFSKLSFLYPLDPKPHDPL